MDRQGKTLLTASELAELGDLMFVAHRLVEGLYAGRHRSPRRGHSTEFYDFRPYLPGDEPQRVDWKLFGRTDRLYVRRFRHESELNIHLLLDRSASMDFAGLGRRQNVSKWTYARQLAAAIAFLAVRQQDRVGLLMFDEAGEAVLPAGGGPEHLRQIIKALESAEPGGRTDPQQALQQAHAAIRGGRGGRGMLVVISDMLEPAGAWCSAFAPFVHDRFDLLALQILHPQELDLRGVGGARLVDRETHQSLRLFGPRLSADYGRRMRLHLDRLRRGLARQGVDHQMMLTSRPPLEALGRFVAGRADTISAAPAHSDR